MTILLACVPMHHGCARCPQRPEVDIRSPGTGVIDDCELPCGLGEPNPGPLGSSQFSLILLRQGLLGTHYVDRACNPLSMCLLLFPCDLGWCLF